MATVPSSRTIGTITGSYLENGTTHSYTLTTYLITSYTQSAANNTSTVSMHVRAVLTSGSAPFRLSSWAITGNGGTRSGSESFMSSVTPRNYASSSKTITHGTGGGSTFSSGATVTVQHYQVIGGVNKLMTLTQTLSNASYSLPTINVYSSLSFSNTKPVMGDTLTMTISKASVATSGVRIQATYDGTTETVYEGTGTSCSWEVPDLVSTTLTSTQKAITISIQSIKGSTYYTAKSYTIYAQVPSTYVPTVTISNVNDQYNFGQFIKGYSKLNIFADATVSDTGVTITGYSVSVREPSASGNLIYAESVTSTDVAEQFTMAVPITSVTTYIEVTVTDSRGRTGTASATVTAVDYIEPQMSITSARCNANGTLNPVGNYINVEVTWSITQIGTHNQVTENLKTYLSTNGGSFAQVNFQAVSGYSGVVTFVTALNGGYPGVLYSTLKDSISAQVQSNLKAVPKTSIPLSMYDDGTDLGVTFGGIAAAGGFNSYLPAQFSLDGTTLPGAMADYVIETGTSGNWAYRKWASGKKEAWLRQTISITTPNTSTHNNYTNALTLTLPSGLFSADPTFCNVMAFIPSAIGNEVRATLNGVTSTTITYRVRTYAALSSSTSTTVMCYVIGS